MTKYLFLPLFLLLSGCSHFTVNATSCDDLMRNDPNSQNIPSECRDYNEKEADQSTYPPGERPVDVNKDFNIGK